MTSVMRWDEAACVDALRRVRDEQGEMPTGEEFKALAAARDDLPSLGTLVVRFGSWSAALDAAGYAARRGGQPVRWNEAACIRALRRVAAEHGGMPTGERFNALAAERDDLPSVATVTGRFGSWSAAVDAAGFVPRPRGSAPLWDRARCIEALQRLVAELGEVPTSAAYRRLATGRPDLPSPPTLATHCGSWAKALEAAGFEAQRHRPELQWDETACIDALRRAADELGEAPTHTSYARLARGRKDLPASQTLLHRFGSMAAALAAAGFELPQPPAWDEADCIAALQGVVGELDGVPSRAAYSVVALGREDLPSPHTLSARFGSWTAALEAAGLEVPTVRWDEAACIDAVQRLVAELGEVPTGLRFSALASQRDDLPGAVTLRRQFGSWSAALEAAGFDARPAPWDEAACVEALQRVAGELGGAPTRSEYQRLAQVIDDVPSMHALTVRFGSWSAALAAAGLRARSASRWDEAAAVAALQRVAVALGDVLSVNRYAALASRRKDLPSVALLSRLFGSWSAALEAAGLDALAARRAARWDGAACVRALRRLTAEIGATPTRTEYFRLARGRDDLPPEPVLAARFGSWSAALRVAALEAAPHLPPADAPTSESVVAAPRGRTAQWDEATCRDALRRVVAELGQVPSKAEYERAAQGRDDLPSLPTLRQRLGPWTTALESAGFTVRQRTWDEPACLAALQRVTTELGAVPSSTEYVRLAQGRADLPSQHTLSMRFGTWAAALDAAGLEYRQQRTWEEPACLDALRRVAAELGEAPAVPYFRVLAAERDDLPSLAIVINRFGSWSAALAAAGLERRPRWPEAACVEALQRVVAERGGVPRRQEYIRLSRGHQDLPSVPILEMRFGSWAAALAAAGFDVSVPRRGPVARWDEAACVAALQRILTEIGDVPTLREYSDLATTRADLPSNATLTKRFGSWSAALAAAGFEARPLGRPRRQRDASA